MGSVLSTARRRHAGCRCARIDRHDGAPRAFLCLALCEWRLVCCAGFVGVLCLLLGRADVSHTCFFCPRALSFVRRLFVMLGLVGLRAALPL